MSDFKAFPTVRVSAVAIRRGAKFFCVFNEQWGGFTLPMSKVREWSDPSVSPHVRQEGPESAAFRAAAEALGRPIREAEAPRCLPLAGLEPYQQSDRDGVWKSYRFEIFEMVPQGPEAPAPSGGRAFAWLSLDDLRQVRPVTPTAIHLAELIEAAEVLQGR